MSSSYSTVFWLLLYRSRNFVTVVEKLVPGTIFLNSTIGDHRLSNLLRHGLHTVLVSSFRSKTSSRVSLQLTFSLKPRSKVWSVFSRQRKQDLLLLRGLSGLWSLSGGRIGRVCVGLESEDSWGRYLLKDKDGAPGMGKETPGRTIPVISSVK